MRSVAALLALLCVAGCGEDPSGPPYAPFDGDWRGSANGLELRMTLEDDEGDVTGTGRMGSPTTIYFNVAGDHDHPRIEFNGYAIGYPPFTFTGSFEHADTVRGRIDGAGFTDDPLLLIRM